MIYKFTSENYLTSFKNAFMQFLNDNLEIPYEDMVQGIPDTSEGGMNLSKPIIFFEIVSSTNLDEEGFNTGKGGKIKREVIRLSLQVVSSGHNTQILKRDRIIDKIHRIENAENKAELAKRYITKPTVRNMGSYRVREGVHLARMEVFVRIKVQR